ncbi:Aspartate-semialdehyde dehydrogenase [Pseudomonas syringae pv. broussonetiae]|uniref:Aspartate-semialdehyde dehydrogenase n=3 Tax=Pseudomonas syringae group genomosp. 2 TaxID=251698 RepID=A0A3M5AXH4_PSESS|nr:aspartate-semialdehyde dehydrogenase [Pseudomonas savastanoi]EGH24120.1 aspartate-semialdehyde dehydrogenase [Pseudomonas amygdali pv. mori str. 301020]KPW59014.1 Aspartate-semialdehyde dehydrogenase [Pseudomonas syringae pv. broussonetiae]KWT05997.1 aspartate-semialdehyde dehydrogenase [Pseudomonas syringae pv. broussonetiae]RMS17595.1 Aspartate-semialdehyde dehydrogenase [Pseudomonas savastanoi]RMT36023.1 Aspartate-semialdehyde dehydrogenase [Pseudomonas savastanoi]
MSQSFDIAVIGATGTVGETVVQVLEERNFPVGNLHLLASIESAGHSVPFRGKNVRVREVDEFDFSKVRLAFFAAGPAVSRSYAEKAVAAGCSVVDLSGAFPAVQAPNIVPEINATLLHSGAAASLVASPSASATAVALALAPLRGLIDIQSVTVTACLAVSALGREGVSELARQTTELLNVRPLETRFFDRQMAFNVLAQVGRPDESGHLPLERRLVDELRELLTLPSLKVSVTCIQVPVFFGDSFTVTLRTAGSVDVAAINAALESAAGIELVDEGDYPTPVSDAVGQDVVYVGRVRAGIDDPEQLNLWLTSDNVRKGAALNAVQVGELLIKDYV